MAGQAIEPVARRIIPKRMPIGSANAATDTTRGTVLPTVRFARCDRANADAVITTIVFGASSGCFRNATPRKKNSSRKPTARPSATTITAKATEILTSSATNARARFCAKYARGIMPTQDQVDRMGNNERSDELVKTDVRTLAARRTRTIQAALLSPKTLCNPAGSQYSTTHTANVAARMSVNLRNGRAI